MELSIYIRTCAAVHAKTPTGPRSCPCAVESPSDANTTSDESLSKFILSGIAAHTVVMNATAGALTSDFSWMERLETRAPFEGYGGKAFLNATTGDLLYITLRVRWPVFSRCCCL